MTSVVILGGSFAGLTAAFELKRKMPALDVTVISTTDRFWFIPSLIWVPFGRRRREDISFELKPCLERRGIKFIHDTASKINAEKNFVVLKGREIPYNYLIIATGPSYDRHRVTGLQHGHGTCNIAEAESFTKAWQAFLKAPGPIVVASTQGASCFGAAYELVFNVERGLRKARISSQGITFVTPEPFLSHFGIGGMLGAEPLVKGFFKFRGISAITNTAIKKVLKGKVVLGDDRELPYKLLVVVPPFVGQPVVGDLGNKKGFVDVDDCYRHTKHRNIYAVGIAAAVAGPGATAVEIGVPKTGFMSEVMARTAADNILRELHGLREKPVPFRRIKPMCIMDAGDMEVLIMGSRMFPPRAVTVLIPNPFGDWFKVLFEKYYLWRIRNGYTWLP